ncbi:hypothetical protein DV515_00011122, partial [Chloebia gouldiae]
MKGSGFGKHLLKTKRLYLSMSSRNQMWDRGAVLHQLPAFLQTPGPPALHRAGHRRESQETVQGDIQAQKATVDFH